MATRYNYTGGIVTNGLVLNLDAAKLDSYPNTGSTWFDISGNNNNGTLTNGPTFSGVGKQASIVFDGVDDYVALGTGNAFNLSGRTFTINAWFNATVWNVSWQVVVAKGDDSWRIHRSGFDTSGRIAFGTSGLTNTDLVSNTIININTWYNTVFTWDGSSKIIYINGIQDNIAGGLAGTLNIGAFQAAVGYNSQYNQRFFNGRIPIVQIYHRALSAQEVSQNFNAVRGRFGI